MDIFIPENSIVAIVRGDASLPMKELLGTGFVVGESGALAIVTARHVIEGQVLTAGDHIAIAFRQESGIRFVVNPDISFPSKHDVAILDASNLPSAIPMVFALGKSPQNLDVLAYEYSSTRVKTQTSRTTKVSVEPHMHKGNVTLHFESTFPEKIPTPSFLTSFPALIGASGAPVFLSHNGAVIGMLVANYERHLLPAQIERVTTGPNTTEEIRYFLPMGKALAASAILDCLRELSIPALSTDWHEGLPKPLNNREEGTNMNQSRT